jgi:hypothetical protein
MTYKKSGWDIISITENRLVNVLIALFASAKFGFILFHISGVIFNPVASYEVGESMLNYSQGFQRRSLLGAFVLLFTSHIAYIYLLLKVLGLLGLGCLIFIILLQIRKYAGRFIVGFIIIFTCSPFGMSFYCDWFLKKEVLFFAFFLMAFFALRIDNEKSRFVIINILVVLGCLVHESFVFLGLPFISCLCYIKGQKAKYNMSLYLTALATIIAIFLFSAGPEPALTNYLISMQRIGLDTLGDFANPVKYMRMGQIPLLRYLFERVKVSSISFYVLLYLVNLFLVCTLLKTYAMSSRLTGKIFSSLLYINLAMLPLLFMGIDYGRWFSFAFLSSVTLFSIALSNHKLIAPSRPVHFSAARNWVIFSVFFLLIKIPLNTIFDRHSVESWGKTFLTFKNGD